MKTIPVSKIADIAIIANVLFIGYSFIEDINNPFPYDLDTITLINDNQRIYNLKDCIVF